jgi:hypothetical protein
MMAQAGEEYTLTMPQQDVVSDSVTLQPEGYARRSFNFGTVWVGQTRYADFVLRAGNFPLRIHGLNVTGRYYNASTNCPNVLFPGQACLIRASYSPWQQGSHFGRITLWVANDVLEVDLWGRAQGRGGGGPGHGGPGHGGPGHH